MASNSEEPQASIVYAICKICGISEPQEDLEDGTCEYCISGKSQITVADISRLQDKKTSTKQNREPLSFIYFWLGAGVSIYLGIYIMSEYDSMWGLSLILTVAPILILYPIVRFIFGLFGMNSRIGILAATVVVEEVLKSKLFKAISESEKKK